MSKFLSFIHHYFFLTLILLVYSGYSVSGQPTNIKYQVFQNIEETDIEDTSIISTPDIEATYPIKTQPDTKTYNDEVGQQFVVVTQPKIEPTETKKRCTFCSNIVNNICPVERMESVYECGKFCYDCNKGCYVCSKKNGITCYKYINTPKNRVIALFMCTACFAVMGGFNTCALYRTAEYAKLGVPKLAMSKTFDYCIPNCCCPCCWPCDATVMNMSPCYCTSVFCAALSVLSTFKCLCKTSVLSNFKCLCKTDKEKGEAEDSI